MSALTKFNQKIKNLRDDEQIAAIRCNTNCVVTAGAGSGKTMVLSYRFVRLIVEERCHVDEILTLTFTRLAAAEMYSRIQAELYSLADDELIEEELKLFTKATITTIDAFCHRIVASDPTRYGLPVDFILDEEESRVMARESALALFKEEADHPGLKALASYAAPDTLMDQVLVPLATKHFHPSTAFNKESMKLLAIDQFVALYQEVVETFLKRVNALLEIDYHTPLYFKNLTTLQEIASKGGKLSDPANFGNLGEYYSTLKIDKLRGKQEGVLLDYNALVDHVRQLNKTLILAEAALANREMLKETYSFLELFYYRYLKSKRERGVLNHGDVANMARDILLNNPTVRRYWQGRFRYILVDEFQDTNRLQKELVYLLAARSDYEGEGVPPPSALQSDKLFFVGDEKQSIYRFRDADVRVFKRLGKEIVASGGEKILLKHNYRSEPSLVSFYNSLFAEIMGESSEEYEAQFEKLESRGATPDVSPKIEFHFKELPEEDDQPVVEEDDEIALAVEAEAYAIGELIEKMVESDEYLIKGEGEVRRPRYEDIAILLRTASNQLHYERALRVAEIPYTLSTVQSLFLEAPANDIYNFLQLLLFPDDKLAYLALLRSPFAYLSDDTILELLDYWEGAPFAHSPSRPPEAAKFTATKELFERLQELAKTETVASLVSFLWYEGGYRNHLLRDSRYQVYLEHFDYLFELAVTYDRRGEGLVEYLDFLRPRLGDKERLDDIEPLKAIEEGVKILTIHKSKGLEFPIVIVANIGTTPAARSKPGWHEVEVDDELLLLPNHMPPVDNKRNLLYERDREIEKMMESAEMKRLFYVALTRAESHLCLFGTQNKINLREGSAEENFLALFMETVNKLGVVANLTSTSIEDISTDRLKTSITQSHLDKTVSRMTKSYIEVKENRAPRRLTYSVSEYTKGEREGEGIPLPTIAGDYLIEQFSLAAPFGTWTHAIIQSAIEKGVESLSEEEMMALIPKEIRRLRLSATNLVTLSNSALSLAEGFLQGELYRELRDANPLSFESEVPFAFRTEEGIVVNGVIDLLVRYKEEVKVVDFKTDAFLNPTLHQGQLNLYRQAMERLYNLPTSSAVVYLRDCSQTEWIS